MLVENFRWKHKCNLNVSFSKFLSLYILFYFPLFIRYHFAYSYTNEDAFRASAFVVLGWAFLSDFIKFCRSKCKNNFNKLNVYQRICDSDEEHILKVKFTTIEKDNLKG